MNLSILRKRALMLMVGMMLSVVAFAQDISGTVKDATGDPIIGASVQVKGTQQGAVTDFDGKFTLKNVKAGQSLVVSYVGYLTQNVKVGNQKNISITMKEDAQALDELVVVGYGTQRKADVTGATARVSAKELTAMPVKSALEGMQGKAAGVDITSSQRPGEIGGINIRGVRSLNAQNSPLYVVDGMVVQADGGISGINPADIESIDILKDASATAIYGSRGANGVVLVTTKKGSAGKVSVNYSGTVTFETMHDVAKQMSAAEWLDYSRMANYTAGSYASTIGEDGRVVPVESIDQALYGGVSASWANIAQAYENGTYNRSKVGGYNWSDKGKQTGITHEHTLSISGGTESFKGYGSFGYLNNEGVQPGQEYTRYTAKVSFEANPLPYFSMGTTINGSFGEQDYGYSFTKSTTGAGDYYNALRGMLPWTSPYDENGEFIRLPNGDVNIINPLRELDLNLNQRKTFKINGSFFGQLDFGKMWKPLAGLKYRLQFGPEFRYFEGGQLNKYGSINSDNSRKTSWNHYQSKSWVLDNLIYYDRTIGDHKIGLTLMQSASSYHTDNINASNSNIQTDDEMWYNIGTPAAQATVGSGYSENQMTSYMIRANYSFADKYLLTASIRWDGSSVLAPGHKWATFPSASLGWRISDEAFMESTRSWIDQLKIRAGVGVTGNAAIGAYSTKGAIQGVYYHWGPNAALGYVGSDASAKTPSRMANPELGWERTTQWNYGLDYAFLNNRIFGSLDVYTTDTKDLLMLMTIPSLTGYTQTYANVGRTTGWGIDLQATAVPFKTKDWEWDVTLTWSLDRSKIKELANGNKEDINNRWFVGKEIGVFYDYVYDGIWKTDQVYTVKDAEGVSHDYTAADYNRKTGQIRVADLNGDGKIDGNNDRKIVGSVRPKWSAGLSTSLKYQNWDLSVFLYSRWGFTVPAGAANLDGRYMQRSLDYFVPKYNENAEYYQPGINGQSADTYQSSMNYQDGSFIKVRNISLGYTFNKKQLSATGLSNVKIYAQVMNPFRLYSKCDWLDTDLRTYDNNASNFGSLTTLRSFVIGLNIGF